MAKELNLDQLSDAMRRQQEGNTNGKRIVWDESTLSFQELSAGEQVANTQSPINDVSKKPFYIK